MKTYVLHTSDNDRVTLTAYIVENSPELSNWEKRPAVLVIPGGAYMKTSAREADPVAFSFLAQGFHAFILRYSVGEFSTFPTPFIDASRAMKAIRDHADEWHIDKDKIAVCGFSAGGHLAACLGTLWNEPKLIEAAGISKGENQPNALILGYPVITCQLGTNDGLDIMWNMVIGNQSPEHMEELLSCERHVGSHTPPTFLFHTFNDDTVPVENSLLFAQALARQDIPFELHIYPNGAHGLSLASELTSSGRKSLEDRDAAGWFALSSAWLWRLFGRPVAEVDRPTQKPRAKIESKDRHADEEEQPTSKYSLATKLSDILADDEAKHVLEVNEPTILMHPYLRMAMNIPLRKIFAAMEVSDKTAEKIAQDLATIASRP